MQPFLVGIAGPTSSGKTTALTSIAAKRADMLILHVDDYYLDDDDFPRVGQWINWELPSCIDAGRLLADLKSLREGRRTLTLRLDHASRRRSEMTVEPKSIIAIEGMHILAFAKVRERLDYAIFIKVSEVASRARRLTRDPDLPPAYIDEVVLPAAREHVVPCRQFADIIVNGNRPLDRVTNELERQIVRGYHIWQRKNSG